MKTKLTSDALHDLKDLRESLADLSPDGLVNMMADIKKIIQSILRGVSKVRKTAHNDIWEKHSPRYKFLIPYCTWCNVVYFRCISS